MVHRPAVAIFATLAALGIAGCGSSNPGPTASPTPSPTASPLITPVPSPTATPSLTPAPTAVPTPTASPGVTLTTTCDVAGTAQGGKVSWTGASAYRQLVIDPGNIVVNPVHATGEYGPLTAGTYTYEFSNSTTNSDLRGQFSIGDCST